MIFHYLYSIILTMKHVLIYTTFILFCFASIIPIMNTESTSTTGGVRGIKEEGIGEQIFTLSNSKEIEPVFSVNSGSEFTIKIHGNKTTGYLWSLDTQFLETEHVSPLNLIEGENTTEDYIVNNHDEGVVGVGGVYEFRFKIAENFKGKTILNFMNKRPWEKEAIQTETAVIDVY